MLTFVFIVLLLAVLLKIIIFAIKAAWGISKILLTVILFPIIFIVMAFTGFLSLAIGVLIIIGIVSLIAGLVTKI